MAESEMKIELLEGETLTDALMRLAKERVKEVNDLHPELVESVKPKDPQPKNDGRSQSLGSRSRKSKDLSAQALGGDPSEGCEPEEIYMAVHVYQRTGETDQKARSNAKFEREMHGPGTLVFSHLHLFGSPCSETCKARIGEKEYD